LGSVEFDALFTRRGFYATSTRVKVDEAQQKEHGKQVEHPVLAASTARCEFEHCEADDAK
jgi:hypothetical protein